MYACDKGVTKLSIHFLGTNPERKSWSPLQTRLPQGRATTGPERPTALTKQVRTLSTDGQPQKHPHEGMSHTLPKGPHALMKKFSQWPCNIIQEPHSWFM